jgi:hypothetical protein
MPSSRPRATLADPLAPSWPSAIQLAAPAVRSVAHGASRTTGPAAVAEEPFAVRQAPAETEPLPIVHRGTHGPAAGLELVRASTKGVATVPDLESIRRQVEERVERTIVERMERLVARELSADSAPLSRLSERVSTELSEALVLERERLGWS